MRQPEPLPDLLARIMLLDHRAPLIAANTATGPRLRMSRTTERTKKDASSAFTRHPPGEPTQKKNRHGHRSGELQKISAQAQKIRPAHRTPSTLNARSPNRPKKADSAAARDAAQK